MVRGRNQECRPARNKTLAKRNRRIHQLYNRQRHALTQVEIADEMGVSQPVISKVLNNPCAMTVA